MTSNPVDTMPVVYPCLFYTDAPAALAWLERAFGFKTRMTVPGSDHRIEHSELSFGSCVIMVSSEKPASGWTSPKRSQGVSQSLCVFVDDPDAHHARAVAAGAEVILPLKDESYGSRGYTCRDPEGHVWTFGTYVPGAYWDKE